MAFAVFHRGDDCRGLWIKPHSPERVPGGGGFACDQERVIHGGLHLSWMRRAHGGKGAFEPLDGAEVRPLRSRYALATEISPAGRRTTLQAPRRGVREDVLRLQHGGNALGGSGDRSVRAGRTAGRGGASWVGGGWQLARSRTGGAGESGRELAA